MSKKKPGRPPKNQSKQDAQMNFMIENPPHSLVKIC